MAYVAMELAEGKLGNGRQYIAKDALLARRAPQVAMGIDATYGMGLMVDTVYGTPVVHHGGDMIGFHSDMMWLSRTRCRRCDPDQCRSRMDHSHRIPPEAPGGLVRWQAGGDGQIVAQATAYFDEMAAERKLLAIPQMPQRQACSPRATRTPPWVRLPLAETGMP
jgi:hypothetical protein